MRRLIYMAPAIAIFILLYITVKKRRVRPSAEDHSFGVDDPKVLSAAEDAVKDLNMREEFSKHYDFLDSFATIQGYSEEYMIQMVQMLAKNEIGADFLFVESGPPGMTSYTHRQGTFELHVQKGKSTEAIQKIQDFIDNKK